MIDKETAAKVKDEAWCEAFITAWNVQACAADGLRIIIGELEGDNDDLAEALDAAKAKLAEMTYAFDALAFMMRRERLNG
jgi:hypothetical protein